MKSPGYRTSRALDIALLPPNDPVLREATPATLGTVTLADVKQYHATTMRPDLTTIVVIGDTTPEEAKAVITKWFGEWKADGPKPETTLPAIPVNKASAANVPDPQAVQDSVVLAQQLNLNRFDPDYYPLQLGNHVLGGGFYATRLYHDLRQVADTFTTLTSAWRHRRPGPSQHSVTYGCDPDKVSKARALIQRDLDQMQTEDVSADELHQAKALQQVGQNIQRLLRCVGRARVLCHRALDFSPHRQQFCTSIHLVPRSAVQRRPSATFQFRTVAGPALCLVKFFACRCLLGRVPAAYFRHRLLIHMADILVTPEAIHIIGFDDVLVNQHFHLTPRSAKRFERHGNRDK